MTARSKSKSVQLPISAELAEALREIMPVGDDKAPVAIMGWPAPGRHWRKIVATYANGWSLRVHFNRHGQVSSSRASISMITGRRGSVVIDEAAA